MLRIYFSVLDPDRHPSVPAMLGVSSLLGMTCGICVYRQYTDLMQTRFEGKGFIFVMLGVFLAVFLLGFSRAGRIWIPVLFLFFSSLTSELVFPILEERSSLMPWETVSRLLGLAAIFVAAFFLSAQAILYSRKFSASRHISGSHTHRTAYFLAFILLSFVSAGGAACLLIL